MADSSLEVNTPGSNFITSPVHLYWKEGWNFPNVEIIVYVI